MRIEIKIPGGEIVDLDDSRLATARNKLEKLDDKHGPAEPVREAWAAAHIAMLPSYSRSGHSLDSLGAAAEIAIDIDWGGTLDFRRHLADHGFGIAEAMDTAQRFYIGWENAERLIQRTGALHLPQGFIAGAGTDHLLRIEERDALIDGWVWQAERIRTAGGSVILLPQPWICAQDADADDYVEIYTAAIDRIPGPIYIHWLGEMFLPELAGYFPGDSFSRIMAHDPDKVRGCKMSLLDADLERKVRAEIAPRGQIMLTGDDFHFAEMILGDDDGSFSHALLGIFDGCAAPAGVALRLLAHGDREEARRVLLRCEILGRKIFETPTRHYKAGLAFLSWLNGFQGTPMLVNREERARSREHLLEVARLATRAGAIEDAEVAAERLEQWLSN